MSPPKESTDYQCPMHLRFYTLLNCGTHRGAPEQHGSGDTGAQDLLGCPLGLGVAAGLKPDQAM